MNFDNIPNKAHSILITLQKDIPMLLHFKKGTCQKGLCFQQIPKRAYSLKGTFFEHILKKGHMYSVWSTFHFEPIPNQEHSILIIFQNGIKVNSFLEKTWYL